MVVGGWEGAGGGQEAVFASGLSFIPGITDILGVNTVEDHPNHMHF